MITNEKGFYGLSIAPGILQVIARHKFIEPTPIQERSIPVAIEGKDLMGIAQTGTGKTLAFGIPMIQRILQNKGVGLIVLPTRELALQVREALHKIGGTLGIKTVVLIGGAYMGRQIREISERPNIIIGTPGRIIDHLDRRTLNLSNVKILVLDEADRMLDMGFAPQLKRIMHFVPTERQTMLFSATMPPDIVRMARAFMKLPVQIEIAPLGTAASTVTHEVFILAREQKNHLLQKLLADYRGSVLVFMRTKFGAKKVARDLKYAHHSVSELHSNRTPGQRRESLEGFKNGSYRVLVATDIAARGIDVTNIELVINYDLPKQAEDYVHRIGRTGRAGAAGHAISFVTPDQRGDLRKIERFLRKSLPLGKLPESLPKPILNSRFSQEGGSYSRRPARQGGTSSAYGGTKRRFFRPFRSNRLSGGGFNRKRFQRRGR
ncbi:MAG: DEAD/DEAH box helicase [Candidatus Brennerbacteria bacterium]|nr:DEAD/DEAH box helicase [Candidatus Brennerbacteria bacterium]